MDPSGPVGQVGSPRHLDSICPRYPPNYWLHIEGRLYRYEDIYIIYNIYIHIYIYIYIGIYIYTGCWLSHPSEKYEFVSWGYEIPNIWENKKCSKPPTRTYIYTYKQPICIVSLCHPYLMVSSTELFAKLPRVWSKSHPCWIDPPFFMVQSAFVEPLLTIINHY
jgi:hypothetical protein